MYFLLELFRAYTTTIQKLRITMFILLSIPAPRILNGFGQGLTLKPGAALGEPKNRDLLVQRKTQHQAYYSILYSTTTTSESVMCLYNLRTGSVTATVILCCI